MTRPLLIIGDDLYADGIRVGTLTLPEGSLRGDLLHALQGFDLDRSSRAFANGHDQGHDEGYAKARKEYEGSGWDRGYAAGYDDCAAGKPKKENHDDA